MTSRIAHLIAHHGAQPWQIVAITFTNKAANEMRERLTASLGPESASQIFAGTFHSLCYRILRRSISLLENTGRTEGWNLYDQDASQAVIYKLVRAAYPEWKAGEARDLAKKVQSRISRMKNALGTWLGLSSSEAVDQYYLTAVTDGEELSPGQKALDNDLSTWFDMYEKAMRDANALDFDDLLGYTTGLLRNNEDLRTRLRRRWRHILVDEFQDTNSPQYEMVKLLAAPNMDKSDSTETTSNSSNSTSDGVPIQQQDNESSQHRGHVFAVGDPDQGKIRNERTSDLNIV